MDPFAYIQQLKFIGTLVLGYFCYRSLKKVYNQPAQDQISESEQENIEQQMGCETQQQADKNIIQQNNHIQLNAQISDPKEPQNIQPNQQRQISDSNQILQIEKNRSQTKRRLIRKFKRNSKGLIIRRKNKKIKQVIKNVQQRQQQTEMIA